MHAYSNVGTVECVGLSLGNALLFASYDSSFVMSSAYKKYSLYLALFYTVFVFVCVCVCVYQLSSMDTDRPVFQPYPSELVFQNFTPALTYKLRLLLLNNNKVCE